jgi:hypothetical protein
MPSAQLGGWQNDETQLRLAQSPLVKQEERSGQAAQGPPQSTSPSLAF